MLVISRYMARKTIGVWNPAAWTMSSGEEGPVAHQEQDRAETKTDGSQDRVRVETTSPIHRISAKMEKASNCGMGPSLSDQDLSKSGRMTQQTPRAGRDARYN